MRQQQEQLEEAHRAAQASVPVAGEDKSKADPTTGSGSGGGDSATAASSSARELGYRNTGVSTGLLRESASYERVGTAQLDQIRMLVALPPGTLPPINSGSSCRHSGVCGWTVGHKVQHGRKGSKRLGLKWVVDRSAVQGPTAPASTSANLPLVPRPPSTSSAHGSARLSAVVSGAANGPETVGGSWVPQSMGHSPLSRISYSHSIFGQYEAMLEPSHGFTTARAVRLAKHEAAGFVSARVQPSGDFISQYSMQSFRHRAQGSEPSGAQQCDVRSDTHQRGMHRKRQAPQRFAPRKGMHRKRCARGW